MGKQGETRGQAGRSLVLGKAPPLLHVANLPIEKRNLQILVNPKRLRSQVDDLVGLAQRGLHLIGRLPLLNARGFGGGLILRGGLRRSCTLRLRRLLAALICRWLLCALVRTLLLSASLVVIADRQQLSDRVFYLARTRRCQSSLRKLEDNIRFVISRRIRLIARIARHDADGDRVFAQIHFDLRRINFISRGEQMRGLLLAKPFHAETDALRQHGIRRMHRSILILGRKHALVGVRHTQDSAFLNGQQSPFINDGIAARIRPHLHELVLRRELFFKGRSLRCDERNYKHCSDDCENRNEGTSFLCHDHILRAHWNSPGRSVTAIENSDERSATAMICSREVLRLRKCSKKKISFTWQKGAPVPALLFDSIVQLALLRAARARSFLLDLRFGLIGLLLLLLQGCRSGGIRLRRWYCASLRGRIRRRRHTARPLLLCQFPHAVGDVLLEVVVHFLEVIHF